MFHEGQKVVCINDQFTPASLINMLELRMVSPVKGKVYTIRAVVLDPEGTGILLEEIRNAPVVWRHTWLEPLFFSWRFSPFEKSMAEFPEERELVLVESR